MARPGFQSHPKFTRLCHMLGEPVPHVWGYLECLWNVGYQTGNAKIGDATDVTLATQHPLQDKKIVAALAECRLIDEVEDGIYAIHDMTCNAPGYVSDRAKKYEESMKEKECSECKKTYKSSDIRSEYCSATCRSRSFRRRKNATDATDATDRNGSQPFETVFTAQNSTEQDKDKIRWPWPETVIFPEALDNVRFKTSFKEWFEYRRSSKLRKWKDKTIDRKLKELADHGIDAAIDAIDFSIGNGYQGLVFRNGNSNGSKPNLGNSNSSRSFGGDYGPNGELFESKMFRPEDHRPPDSPPG